MTHRALVTALAALSLAGCATTFGPGALTPDPIQVARLPATGEPVKLEAAAQRRARSRRPSTSR